MTEDEFRRQLRAWQQREYGMCSEPDCDEPIYRACPLCKLKLCMADLEAHRVLGCFTTRAIALHSLQMDPKEPA